jgi:hypothetical protein
MGVGWALRVAWLQIEPVRRREPAGETNRERELGLDRRETG